MHRVHGDVIDANIDIDDTARRESDNGYITNTHARARARTSVLRNTGFKTAAQGVQLLRGS